jgi:hypothetical protein
MIDWVYKLELQLKVFSEQVRTMAQVTLFAHGSTPNPLKIAIILEELQVSYVIVDKVSKPVQ